MVRPERDIVVDYGIHIAIIVDDDFRDSVDWPAVELVFHYPIPSVLWGLSQSQSGLMHRPM